MKGVPAVLKNDSALRRIHKHVSNHNFVDGPKLLQCYLHSSYFPTFSSDRNVDLCSFLLHIIQTRKYLELHGKVCSVHSSPESGNFKVKITVAYT